VTQPHELAASRARARIARVLRITCIVSFLGAILAPTADTFVRDDMARGPAPELRTAAREPAWQNTQAAISAWPAAYDAYFNDTCGLRDVFLRMNSWVKYFVFRNSPSAKQLVGREGWIYYAGDKSVDVYRGTFPFVPGALATWAAELENRRKALDKVGIRYVFAIAPNKETIYPEYVNPAVTRLAPTRLDDFMEYVHAHTSVDVLDLRPALFAAKSRDTGPMDALYTPHGTHWSGRGSMVVYGEIVRHVASLFPGTTFVPPEEFDLVPVACAPDSFAKGLYLEGILRQPGTSPWRRGNPKFRVKESRDALPRWMRTVTQGENLLPHTLLFHDSFGPFVQEQLADSFSTLDTHEGEYDPRSVAVGDTKLVIEMWVERYLVNHAPNAMRDERVGSRLDSFVAAPHRLYTFDATTATYTPVGGITIEPADGPDGRALTISRTLATEGLRTSVFRTPAQGDVLVHVVLESDRDATFEVMWRTTRSAPFNRLRRVSFPLRVGRFENVFDIPALGDETELFLRPTETGARLRLSTFEVRSREAP